MFAWIEALYARLRNLMPQTQRDSLDLHLEYGGYGVIFGDCVEFAAKNDLLTDEDRENVVKTLDLGLLRKAKPHFMELIAA